MCKHKTERGCEWVGLSHLLVPTHQCNFFEEFVIVGVPKNMSAYLVVLK